MNANTLGGAAIQGGLGIIGSGLQYVFNKKLAAQQNQYNIDMWNMQNEYNSPQAQMQRFQEAGLNPNLIYGQGNNGNSSQAPQMVVPDAPRVDKAMEELGKAFHLEQLRKLHFEAEAAKEAADSAAIDNANKRDERKSWNRFGNDYEFNPTTGEFEYQYPSWNTVTVEQQLTKQQMRELARLGALHTEYGRLKGRLADFRRQHYPLTTVPYRNAFLNQQKLFLVPQTYMRNYDWHHYPQTFFIDRMNKPAGALYGLYNWAKGWWPF